MTRPLNPATMTGDMTLNNVVPILRAPNYPGFRHVGWKHNHDCCTHIWVESVTEETPLYMRDDTVAQPPRAGGEL